MPDSKRYDIARLRFKGDKSNLDETINWYSSQVKELNEAEDSQYMDKLATLAVLLLSDLPNTDEETFNKVSASLETEAPIIVEALKWLVKPYQPYYWPQGDRPPVGIFAPRIRNNRDDKRDRSKGKRNERPKDGRKKRNERHDTSNLKSKALRNADFGIGKMKKDKKLEEFELSPINSFYRRIQHQHIIDNGFDSYSVGDGADRKVVIKRK